MKVLLLNPSVNFDKQFGTLSDFYSPIPSIGLAYLGAVLKKANFEVEGQDSFIACHSSDEMYENIIKSKPDILGITMLTPTGPMVDPILKKLRKEFPNLIIVLGNVHASTFHDYYLSGNLADYVVHHEGEETFLELVSCLRDGTDTKEIKGISYFNKEESKVIKTPTRPWINVTSLENMPYPAWEIFPVDEFKLDIRLQGIAADSNENEEVFPLPILGSRGCPFNCTFCTPKNTIGNKYRMRSPKSLADEMEHWYNKWGVKTFFYMDLTFPISEKKGVEFCDHLIERNLPVSWQCETRVSAVTPKLLEKMKLAGCSRIFYGIESGNQKMLDSVNKKTTVQQIKDAAKWSRESGVESEGGFIIGFPGETKKDTQDTIDLAISLDLDHIKLNLFVPYPGSDVYDQLKKEGKLTNMDFNEYTPYPTYTGGQVPFVPEGRTHEDLIAMQKKGMRRAFFRKRVILRELKSFRLKNIPQYWAAVTSLLFPKSEKETKSFS